MTTSTESGGFDGRFDGRFGIVTGGARGIGEAIARAYVARGGRCAIIDLDEERGRAVAGDLSADFVQVDVTDADALEASLVSLAGQHGRLDHLFSNAGATGVLGSLLQTSVADWNHTMNLLLTSTFVGVRTAARIMTRQGTGSIVCTASVASIRSGLGPHAYTVAKRGVLALVESAAVELVGTGVRVNAVAPGGTVTGLAATLASGAPDDLAAAEERLATASRDRVVTTADDVASAALFLAHDAARRINGACLVVDGAEAVHSDRALGFFRHSPGPENEHSGAT